MRTRVRLSLFLALLLVGVSIYNYWIKTGIKSCSVDVFAVLNGIEQGMFEQDVLVLGSSRAMHHVDPEIVQRKTGLTAINLGVDGVRIAETMALVNWYLENCPKPTDVVINVDINSFESIQDGVFRADQYFTYVGENSLYHGLSKHDFRLIYARYLPIFNGLTTSDFTRNLALRGWMEESRMVSNGYYPLQKRNEQIKLSYNHPVSIQIDSALFLEFDKLIARLDVLGVRTHLLISPYSAPYFKRINDFAGYKERITNLKATSILDFSTIFDENSNAMFTDVIHLNSEGAREFSIRLSDTLASIIGESKMKRY